MTLHIKRFSFFFIHLNNDILTVKRKTKKIFVFIKLKKFLNEKLGWLLWLWTFWGIKKERRNIKMNNNQEKILKITIIFLKCFKTVVWIFFLLANFFYKKKNRLLIVIYNLLIIIYSYRIIFKRSNLAFCVVEKWKL